MFVIIAKFFQILVCWPVHLLLRALMDFKVEGQENLEGLEDEAIIFASNHASWSDSVICAAAMPSTKFYPIRFLAKDKLFSWWSKYLVFSFFINLNASIKVFKAGGNLRASLADTILALQDRDKIWIFPEGHISKDGKIHRGRRGVAFLQKITGVPVIPVGISGNYYFLGVRDKKDGGESLFYFKPGTKLTVKIGKPIHSFNGMSLEESVSKIMKEVRILANNE